MNTNLEQMYTVEDIAKMASLTDRTIRNYLRNGRLKGRKIGGQWRFNMEDIKKFLDSSDLLCKLSSDYKQEVTDFIDNINTKITGERQSCVIVDLYLEHEKANRLNEKLCEFTASDSVKNMRFYYEYAEEYQRARFTIFAAPDLSIKFLTMINES